MTNADVNRLRSLFCDNLSAYNRSFIVKRRPPVLDILFHLATQQTLRHPNRRLIQNQAQMRSKPQTIGMRESLTVNQKNVRFIVKLFYC